MTANVRLEYQRTVQDLRYARREAALARHGINARYWETRARQYEEKLRELAD